MLLYADDVILMAHTYKKMNAILDLLKAFCLESGLTINIAKTKMMICSTGPKPTFMYNDHSIDNVQEFKYLGIEIPSSNKWTKCMDKRLVAANKMYHMLETACNHKDINSWKVKCILFEAYVMQTMLYGIEMWGGSISNKMWEDI